MQERFAKSIFLFTIFIGAFLLFLIQPMIAKTLLPYVGGVPSAWVCSIVFFQFVLLLGYLYSAVGSACLSFKEQLILQFLLILACAIIVVPIELILPNETYDLKPELWVIFTLLLSVGMPYFLLASNSTLIQKWYHGTFNDSPYFLFGISNIGSLLGLLIYPFFIERLFTINQQMMLWSIIFIIFTICIFLITFYILKTKITSNKESFGKFMDRKSSLSIITLGFIPSALFLSTTSFISINYTSFLILLIAPLSAYLISLIIAFSNANKIIAKFIEPLHSIAFFIMIYKSLYFSNTITDCVILFVCLFIICLSCHGRVYDKKPSPKYLSSYYLCLAFGGVLGGLFNIAAPYIFNSLLDYYIIIISLLAIVNIKNNNRKYISLVPFKGYIPSIMVVLTITTYTHYLYYEHIDLSKESKSEFIYSERNFFGISRIFKEYISESDSTFYSYVNGNTVHGAQEVSNNKRKTDYTYYKPVFKIVNSLPKSFYESPFGFVGLGVGLFTCLGEEGQKIDFFEIDPAAIKIAQNPEFFTYLQDCKRNLNIIEGDGRIELKKQPIGKYSVIVIDAFSSHTIPPHIITKEAIEMYFSKLRNNGILLIHTSSQYFEYKGVMARIAEELNISSYYLEDGFDNPNAQASSWIILVPKNSTLKSGLLKIASPLSTTVYKSRLWTDDYSNELSILKNR